MQIVKRSDRKGARPVDPIRYTGPGSVIPVSAGVGAADHTTVNFIVHEPGSRTHWHQHDVAQILYAVEGKGYVQIRGREPQLVEPGDTVIAEAGEEHWHGAAPDSRAVHLVVTIGDHRWLESSED
jgi:quercetin dioxygenase-like cupin family protein